MAARFQRQHCFLCDLPHSPWAILNDFTEPVCRGCCNYEGADRIEDVIQYSRYLRQTWEANNGTTRPRGVKAERLNSAGSSMSSTPSPPPSTAVGNGNMTSTFADQRRAVTRFQNPMRLGVQDMAENAYSKSTSPDPNGVGKAHRPQIQGNVPVRDLQERRGSNFALEDPRNAMLNGNAIFHRGQRPLTPNGLSSYPPDSFPRPELVRDTLLRLNTATPFDIRFKKDHNLVGRVFAFDISNKPGMEYELKVLVEYPRGSGIVFQSVANVVKQMYSETVKDFGKGLSSGYRYLEYEKNHERSEWKQLVELLPDAVRYFKEPVSHDNLPNPYLDPAFPILPNVNLNFINSRSGHQPFGRKRPRGIDLEEFEIAAGKRAGHPVMRGPREEHHKHQQWMQNQAESVKMTINSTGTPVALTPGGPIPTAPISPMVSTPISKSSPVVLQVSEAPYSRTQPKSPLSSLMNVAGRFEGPGSREEGRPGNGPNAERISPRQRNSPRPLPRSKTPDVPNGQQESEKEKSQSILTCSICHDRLEDTHFVQCPSVGNHKFCFPCSRESIKAQGAGSEVFCPSGERCPLQGSNLPWAFMQGEIATILGTAADFPVKKEKEA